MGIAAPDSVNARYRSLASQNQENNTQKMTTAFTTTVEVHTERRDKSSSAVKNSFLTDMFRAGMAPRKNEPAPSTVGKRSSDDHHSRRKSSQSAFSTNNGGTSHNHEDNVHHGNSRSATAVCGERTLDAPCSPLPNMTASTSSLGSGPHRLKLSPSRESELEKRAEAMNGFFGIETFDRFIRSPMGQHTFRKFLKAECSEENLDFWYKVTRAKQLQAALLSQVEDIMENHVASGAPGEINVTMVQRNEMLKNVEQLTDPLRNVHCFDAAYEHVYHTMFHDTFQRFVKQQLAKGAHKALSLGQQSVRGSWNGLGDCFCLTDPKLRDNPIVLASDGFVAVTGYTREEIVPFNCRFLQGGLSDPSTVARIRDAIARGEECTELLINYRKDGSPFWNLLHIAPLRDAKGEIRYFLGGQVDVSASLNQNIKIDALVDVQEAPLPSQPLPSANHARRPSERLTQIAKVLPFLKYKTTAAVGAEGGVVEQGRDVSSQIQTFYDLYSRYIVVDAVANDILHVSPRVAHLFDLQADEVSTLCGLPFFNTVVSTHTKKNARRQLKAAFKEGKPCSVVVVIDNPHRDGLAGIHRYMVHLTPLKDVHGVPGAFIAVLAEEVLNDAISTSSIGSAHMSTPGRPESPDYGLGGSSYVPRANSASAAV